MRVEKDDWLSDVLGVPSWRVSGAALVESPADIRSGLLDCAGRQTAFFSTKIPTRDVSAVAKATQAGFSVVDVNVTFDWKRDVVVDARVALHDGGAANVAVARADDAADVEAIAGRCFAFSRFHLDPFVGLDRANEIKRQWARNAFRGRAEAVYVARRGATVTGFLAVLANRSGAGTDAIIDLVGVDGGHQGRGAGRALSMMFVDQWRDRSDRLRVGTQISNIPAMRLYESIGFRMAETSYVLHAHIRNGALVA